MKIPACLAAINLMALWVLLPAVPVFAAEPLVSKKDMDRLNQGTQLFSGVKQAFNQEKMTPLQRQRWAYGVVEQPQLDRALDQILQELRQAAGPKAPESRIHVTPDPSFQAYATDDGSIFIAAGMLQSLDSKDQVAALIAHEYVHVLRQHTGKSKLETAKGIGAGLTSLYLDYEHGGKAAAANRPDIEYVRQALLRETAMQSVQAGIVPSRARKQEDEADRMGTDLMVAAGYNPIGMMDFLGLMEAWDLQRQQEVAAQPAAAQSAVGGTVSRYLQNTDQARNAGRKVDNKELVGGVLSSLVDAGSSLLKRASRSHRASSERSELVLKHIESRHAELERPDMRPLPWQEDRQVEALFVSLAQMHDLLGVEVAKSTSADPKQSAALKELARSPAGKTPLGRYVTLRFQQDALGRKQAMPSLQLELERQDSIFAVHRLVLDLVGRSADREQALQMFDISRSSFNDPPQLLPYGVRMNKRAGKSDAANIYAARCAGSGDDVLKRLCMEEL